MKLLKDWEETGNKYALVSRERKFLRAKLTQLLKVTKVSEQTSVLLSTSAVPVAPRGKESAEEEEEEEVSESG